MNYWRKHSNAVLYILELVLIRVSQCIIYRPVSNVSPLLEPLLVTHVRSKLLCVATCATLYDCVTVQYISATEECSILHVSKTCVKPWLSSHGGVLLHRVEENPLLTTLPVFRVSAGFGGLLYEPFTSASYLSHCSEDVFDLTQKITFTYKHPYLKDWDRLKIKEVRLALLNGGTEVVYLTFDAIESTVTSWFDYSRIKETSFTDLKGRSGVTMSIEGFKSARRFYIRKDHLSCFLDNGWLCLNEKYLSCFWENKPPYPIFQYSTSGKFVTWGISSDYAVADDLLISIVAEI